MSDAPERVEKLMSLTLADFHRSLKTLSPDMAIVDSQTDVIVATVSGDVRIVYKALESATLGGLLALPRARVTLNLKQLDQGEREVFIARFDRAFQRGGG